MGMIIFSGPERNKSINPLNKKLQEWVEILHPTGSPTANTCMVSSRLRLLETRGVKQKDTQSSVWSEGRGKSRWREWNRKENDVLHN